MNVVPWLVLAIGGTGASSLAITGLTDATLAKPLLVGTRTVDTLRLVRGLVEMEFVVTESREANKLVIRIGTVPKPSPTCTTFLFGSYEIPLPLRDRVNGSDMFSG